jgi:enamine deaminase RidA (YjgF/YER057c/UK114 family)
MQIRRINSEAALVPTTGYSQALEVTGHTRMLFVSGQIPAAADGTVPEGFEAQCRLAWSNVEAQLKAAGMTLDNLVMHRTYLADRCLHHAQSRGAKRGPWQPGNRADRRHRRNLRRGVAA